MSRMQVRHRRAQDAAPASGQRGVAIVEVAFALPILLTLLLGFVDIGLATFQTSQASSGAADGARAGIVLGKLIDDTNCATDPEYQKILEAVQARIPDRDLGCSNVIVSCVNKAGTQVGCSAANDLTDSLKVQVRWTWDALSPVGYAIPIGDISYSATMRFVPQPEPPPVAVVVP